MKYRIIVISALIFILGSFGAWISSPALQIKVFLASRDAEKPEEDAKADIRNGNVKCFQVNGFVAYYPGVSGKSSLKICENAERHNIRGTSDGLEDEVHARVQIIAVDYAYKYNQYVTMNWKNEI